MSTKTRRVAGGGIACALVTGACALALSAAGPAAAQDERTSFRYHATVVESLGWGSANDCTQDQVLGSPEASLNVGDLIPGQANHFALRGCLTATVGSGFDVVARHDQAARRCSQSEAGECIAWDARIGDFPTEFQVIDWDSQQYIGFAEGDQRVVYRSDDPAYQRTYPVDTTYKVTAGPDDPPGAYTDGVVSLTAIARD